MEERIVKKLMTSVKCTSCGQKYEMRDVKILGNHEDLYFLQVPVPPATTVTCLPL